MTAPSPPIGTYAGPGSIGAKDPTAVMGRRTLAWVLDLVLYLAVVGLTFASLTEYSDVPVGVDGDLYCEQLRAAFPEDASGCIFVNDQVWLTSESDNAVQAAVSFGYGVFFVLLQGIVGASPGKLLTGLRVVKEDGSRAGIGRSLGRTLMWIIDAAPWCIPLVGFIVGLTSTRHRRVGDMAVGTYVIRRRDVGNPVSGDVAAGVVPPPQSPWDAPPPTAPPTGPPVGPGTPPPSPSAGQGEPTVGELTPNISGVPDDKPAPPPIVDDRQPHDAPPEFDISPPEPTGSMPEPPTMPEIDGAVDQAPPDVGVDPTWWEGPEAQPASDAPAEPEMAEPEMPSWADPQAPVEDADWAPPTTPGQDFDDYGQNAENTSPTAGPPPFVAPGADPVGDAPGTPEAARTPELPPPQWDAARNTYLQWVPAEQKWLQWDARGNRWIDIQV